MDSSIRWNSLFLSLVLLFFSGFASAQNYVPIWDIYIGDGFIGPLKSHGDMVLIPKKDSIIVANVSGEIISEINVDFPFRGVDFCGGDIIIWKNDSFYIISPNGFVLVERDEGRIIDDLLCSPDGGSLALFSELALHVMDRSFVYEHDFHLGAELTSHPYIDVRGEQMSFSTGGTLHIFDYVGGQLFSRSFDCWETGSTYLYAGRAFVSCKRDGISWFDINSKQSETIDFPDLGLIGTAPTIQVHEGIPRILFASKDRLFVANPNGMIVLTQSLEHTIKRVVGGRVGGNDQVLISSGPGLSLRNMNGSVWTYQEPYLVQDFSFLDGEQGFILVSSDKSVYLYADQKMNERSIVLGYLKKAEELMDEESPEPALEHILNARRIAEEKGFFDLAQDVGSAHNRANAIKLQRQAKIYLDWGYYENASSLFRSSMDLFERSKDKKGYQGSKVSFELSRDLSIARYNLSQARISLDEREYGRASSLSRSALRTFSKHLRSEEIGAAQDTYLKANALFEAEGLFEDAKNAYYVEVLPGKALFLLNSSCRVFSRENDILNFERCTKLENHIHADSTYSIAQMLSLMGDTQGYERSISISNNLYSVIGYELGVEKTQQDMGYDPKQRMHIIGLFTVIIALAAILAWFRYRRS